MPDHPVAQPQPAVPPQEGPAWSRLMADYRPLAGRSDLLLRPDGVPGECWHPLLEELSRMDSGGWGRRLSTARRLIRENGVTYNVYDEASGEARPWELDALPLVIGRSAWSALAAGLVQRARLAEALLGDFYGPQRLLQEQLLPPHLLEGHPHYLRWLGGLQPPGGTWLHLHAIDLTQGPDGAWRVISERADAPAGTGYALENRIVASQLFPELFRDMGVTRLAGFFNAFRVALQGLSHAAQPNGVLLTPGPYNEAYFEHAYLARYLGLTLVEGDDLAVRDGVVYLRTLAGLERIDIIVRRIDSDFADPIVFRADSALGVPGLMEAVRAGSVVMANALGGGVLGGPALAACMPQLCRSLLGEELLLPNERTLWCGTPAGRAQVMDELPRLVVRDAFDSRPLFTRGSTARLGAEMSGAERRRLKLAMERRGATFAAQELVPLATAPVLEQGRLLPRPVMLRAFVAWTPEGWQVMPGGLTRVAAEGEAHAISMQAGGASKDTWVLTGGEAETFSLLRPQGEALQVRRQALEAPSRSMDNLFWLGRYAERAEDMVRIQRAVVRRLGDDAGLDATATAALLARRLLVPLAQVSEAAAKEAGGGEVHRLTLELEDSIFDPEHPYGLQRTLKSLRATAWAVRDRLSLDTWRAVISLVDGEGLPGRGPDPDPGASQSYLDGLVRRTAALSGLAAENLTRGRNWTFMELGRRIERASNLAWLLRQALVVPEEGEQEALQLLLEIADSAMTYRYRYLGVFQPAPVIDLLALDESNPRSIAFQLEQLKTLVGELPRANRVQSESGDRPLVARMVARLSAAGAERLAQRDESGRRAVLAELLDLVEHSATELSDAVGRAFFRHSANRRAGFAPRGEGR